VKEGESSTLSCTADGNPPPNIVWYKVPNFSKASTSTTCGSVGRNAASNFNWSITSVTHRGLELYGRIQFKTDFHSFEHFFSQNHTHLEVLPLVSLRFSLGGAILFLLVAVDKTKRYFLNRVTFHFFGVAKL
jgi:hypothetical protein